MNLGESLQFFAATDVGRVRDHNEDNFLVDRRLALFVVADGMGGHAAGEVASALAVRIVHQDLQRARALIEQVQQGKMRDSRALHRLFEGAVHRACARIHDEARADDAKRGMGTTLSALLIAGKFAFIAHVGDSRIYLRRGDRIQQLTEDHTVRNELIKRGRLTTEQIERVAQKNAITRAVGVYETVEVDTLTIEVLPGDQFLLASDGLYGYINHTAELEPYLDDEDGERATQDLIELARRKGGKDNITAVLIRLAGDDSDGARARRLALKREMLAQVPLFCRLSERELLRVMQVTDVLMFDAGQAVVEEGEVGDELFIVLEGMLHITRGEQLLSEVGPGEHFGEMALIRATPRSATVRAVEPTEILAVRRKDFFEILRTEPEPAVKLLWQFVGVLADRLDQTSRDLSTAKTELAAEDITDDIIEMDRASQLPLDDLTASPAFEPASASSATARRRDRHRQSAAPGPSPAGDAKDAAAPSVSDAPSAGPASVSDPAAPSARSAPASRGAAGPTAPSPAASAETAPADPQPAAAAAPTDETALADG